MCICVPKIKQYFQSDIYSCGLKNGTFSHMIWFYQPLTTFWNILIYISTFMRKSFIFKDINIMLNYVLNSDIWIFLRYYDYIGCLVRQLFPVLWIEYYEMCNLSVFKKAVLSTNVYQSLWHRFHDILQHIILSFKLLNLYVLTGFFIFDGTYQ